MTGFNHALAGVTIAITFSHPLVAAVLAVGSHFLLDRVPHFWHDSLDPKHEKFVLKRFLAMVIFDAVLTFSFLGLGMFLFPEHAVLVAVCVALATMPDWLWALHYGLKIKHPFFHWHQKIQHTETAAGVFVELPFMGLMLAIILALVVGQAA